MDADIMKISVKNLAEKQYEFLKAHAINILTTVIEYLDTDKLDEIEEMLVYSPAGDGYGEDNYYINFAYDNMNLDIQHIVEKMKELRKR